MKHLNQTVRAEAKTGYGEDWAESNQEKLTNISFVWSRKFDKKLLN
jgi:hypothetical protein